MAYIPAIPASVLNKAKGVWDESIDKFGQTVSVESADGTTVVTGKKAFCKRPKILGLFDRTEQSYDQTRYIVTMKPIDFSGVEPEKFSRIVWDDEEHAIISVTKVDLTGVVFGYRFLVKG